MGATGFFIVVTAFGLSVLVIESLGLLAGGDDEGGDDGGSADHADGGADGGDGEGESGYSHYLSAATTDGGASDGVAIGRRPGTRRTVRGSGVFRLLFILRMLVYFCCGFGPIGLVSMLVGQTFAASAAAGAGAGFVIMAVAWLWIRLQRRELDSSIPDRDLVGATATVTIAIAPGGTGRVRITLAQTVMDRYAVTAESSRTLAKGEQVSVVGLQGSDVVVQGQ